MLNRLLDAGIALPCAAVLAWSMVLAGGAMFSGARPGVLIPYLAFGEGLFLILIVPAVVLVPMRAESLFGPAFRGALVAGPVSGISLVVFAALAGTGEVPLSRVFASQGVLLTSAALIGSLAIFLMRTLDCRLDAAGLVYLSAFILVGGVLAAGPMSSAYPSTGWMVTPALTINPLVGVASVFQFDIFRTEELYRISPLARRQFAYPSAGVTAMLHVFAAASLVACTALAGRRLPPDSGLALEV